MIHILTPTLVEEEVAVFNLDTLPENCQILEFDVLYTGDEEDIDDRLISVSYAREHNATPYILTSGWAPYVVSRRFVSTTCIPVCVKDLIVSSEGQFYVSFDKWTIPNISVYDPSQINLRVSYCVVDEPHSNTIWSARMYGMKERAISNILIVEPTEWFVCNHEINTPEMTLVEVVNVLKQMWHVYICSATGSLRPIELFEEDDLADIYQLVWTTVDTETVDQFQNSFMTLNPILEKMLDESMNENFIDNIKSALGDGVKSTKTFMELFICALTEKSKQLDTSNKSPDLIQIDLASIVKECAEKIQYT